MNRMPFSTTGLIIRSPLGEKRSVHEPSAKISPPACASWRAWETTIVAKSFKDKASKESRHGCIQDVVLMKVGEIKPSPENDQLYRPPDDKDPEFKELAKSIAQRGVLDPLVITEDGYIISGHRRYAAACAIELDEVPVRIMPYRRVDHPERHLQELREHNRNRDKTLEEKLREELVTATPGRAYRSLIEHRQRQSDVHLEAFKIAGTKKRHKFSAAKQPFVDIIVKVVNDRRKFWPLTDRVIHYALFSLGIQVMRNYARKKTKDYDPAYHNDKKSYGDLCEVLTRMRLADIIPWHSIEDPTRPVTIWDVYQDPRGYMRKELDDFLRNYWRDLMQTQPHHVEIVGEKNTLNGIIRPVAMQYRIPYTLGRGYSSIEPRHAMACRYQRSGKDKLILLMLSDFDCEGEDLGHSFARSMRDDFGIENIHPIKVALTKQQIVDFRLPPMMKAKRGSSRYDKFVGVNGDDVWELEAIPPADLQTILRSAIDSVINVARFNEQLDLARTDADFLNVVRQRAHLATRGQFEDEEE